MNTTLENDKKDGSCWTDVENGKNEKFVPACGCLLTAGEAAEALRCHVSTVYDLYHGGRLKGFSLTGRSEKGRRGKKGLRIVASSVDDYIHRGLTELGQPPPTLPAPPPEAPLPRPTPRHRPVSGSRVVLPLPSRKS